MQVVDIHSHMLYGVDDGSKTIEESLQMLGISYKEGIVNVVLTPHYERNNNIYDSEQLISHFNELKKEVSLRYPDMNLYLGNEILYEEGILEDLKTGKIATMNKTRYILVEYLPNISYEEMYKSFRALIQARFLPILAHVERYRCLHKKMDRIDEIKELGIYLQMNGESILGGIFSEHARWCHKLLKEEQISFIASDAHNCTTRSPRLLKSIEWMKKNLSQSYCNKVLWDNPQMMLYDKYLDE